MSRKNWESFADPRISIEIPQEDFLGRARRQSLRGERGVRAANSVGQGGVVGDEEPFDPPRLSAGIQYGIIRA